MEQVAPYVDHNPKDRPRPQAVLPVWSLEATYFHDLYGAAHVELAGRMGYVDHENDYNGAESRGALEISRQTL